MEFIRQCKCGVKVTLTLYTEPDDPEFDSQMFMERVGWRTKNGEWCCPICNRVGIMYESMKKGEHIK
jgi:hypothetical protein